MISKKGDNIWWISSFIVFIFFILALLISFNNAYKYNDLQPLTVSKVHQLPNNSKQIRLNKNESYTTKVRGYANNLGQLSFKFNTFGKVNSDLLRFQLKEKGEKNWLYDNLYRTDQFQNGGLFPFGFPVISDSQNKDFIITITSIKGTNGDHVAIIEDMVVSKYTFTRSLIKNPILLVTFLVLKMSSMITNSPQLLFILIGLPLGVSILFTFIKSFRRVSINEWRKLIFEIGIRINISRTLQWKRRGEIESIVFVLYFFWFSVFIHQSSKMVLMVISFIPFLYFLFRLIHKIRLISLRDTLTEAPLLIPVILFSLVRASFFDYIPHWDGNIFVNEIIKSTKGLTPLLTNIEKLYFWGGGHPTIGYGSFMSIGQLYFPNSIVIMHIQNLILGLLAIICFYSIIRILLKQKPLATSFLTLIFALNPLFIAVSLSPNMDYPVLCYFVIAFYLLLKEKLILFAFVSSLMVLSKEVGFMLYVQFIVALIASFVLFRNGILAKYIDRIKSNNTLFLVVGYISYFSLPVLAFFLQYISSSGTMWQGNYYINPGTPFMFHPLLFFPRIFEVTILNFSWIMTSIILVGIIFLIKKKYKNPYHLSVAITIGTTWLLFVGVNCFYNTFTHPRYLIVSVFFISLLCVYGLILIKKHIRYILLGIILILFFVSVYKTLDPVSKFTFGTFIWGKNQMLQIGDVIQSRCDSMVYNTEFVNIDRLYRKLNGTIGTTPYTAIFSSIPTTDGTQNWWVRHYDYSQSMLANELVKNIPEGDVYYIFLPWLSNNIDNDIKVVNRYYVHDEGKTIESKGYWLRYYKLNRRDK